MIDGAGVSGLAGEGAEGVAETVDELGAGVANVANKKALVGGAAAGSALEVVS